MNKRWSVVAAFLACGLGLSRPSTALMNWPHGLWLPAHQSLDVAWSRFLPVAMAPGGSSTGLEVDHSPLTGWTRLDAERIAISANRSGTYHLRLRLFGYLPWGSALVRVSAPLYEVPGGESIGVMVRTEGLIVRGLDPVAGNPSPAERAGIRAGDLVTGIDGRRVDDPRAVERAASWAGRQHGVLMVAVRGRTTRMVQVRPLWSDRHHRYELGLYLQDGTSGVGTLTWFDPVTRRYAALGHSLTDGITREPAPVRSGVMRGADIIGVLVGRVGSPGEKVGVLAPGSRVRGTVTENSRFGIGGVLTRLPATSASPIPVAVPDEVHPGPAEVLTVLKGETPEAYRIEILKAVPQWRPATKGILFRVTDPRLIRRAGGIVQGMSGSPIIQNGRLAGAVTHVLVGRPRVGYGCYAIWMIRAAGRDRPHSPAEFLKTRTDIRTAVGWRRSSPAGRFGPQNVE